jgi:hypothetical protein
LAVYPDDQAFRPIYNLDSLSKVVDLDYFKAFMENSYNDPNILIKVDRDYRNDYPYKFLTTEELISMKDDCSKLYNAIWKKLVEIRRVKGAFLAFMRSFDRDYGKEYAKCSKIYRPFNEINYNSRDWFFAFLEGFFLLKDLGYGFTCDSGGWSLMADREFTRHCNNSDINRAFRMIMPTLDNVGHVYMVDNDVFGWVRKNRQVTCYGEQLSDDGPSWSNPSIKWRGFP